MSKLFSKPKIFLFVLSLFFFWTSNIYQIRGGVCESSPCPGINDSRKGEMDYYADVRSVVFVSPSLLFLSPVLKRIDLYEDEYGRSLYDNDDAMEQADTAGLVRGLLLTKLLLLLSLPYWVLLGRAIIAAYRKKPLAAKIVLGVLVVSLLLYKGLDLLIPGGPEIMTWEVVRQTLDI